MNSVAARRSKSEWEAVLGGIVNGYVPIGGKEKAYESGFQCMARLNAAGVWCEGNTIVDIGCGNGRLAIPLTEAEGINYIGIDPIAESISFCKQAFSDWADSFSFHHLDVQNDFYNPFGKVNPRDFRLDIPSDSVDCVLLSSVLTHIGSEKACRVYIDEAHRVLRSGGKLYVTWFRAGPNEEDMSCERTAFREDVIINMLTSFHFEKTWGGLTTEYNDQWAMVLRKKGGN